MLIVAAGCGIICAGVYTGIVYMLVGGIITIIEQIKATHTDTNAVGQSQELSFLKFLPALVWLGFITLMGGIATFVGGISKMFTPTRKCACDRLFRR